MEDLNKKQSKEIQEETSLKWWDEGLPHADLSGASLTEADLSGVDLAYAKLEKELANAIIGDSQL